MRTLTLVALVLIGMGLVGSILGTMATLAIQLMLFGGILLAIVLICKSFGPQE